MVCLPQEASQDCRAKVHRACERRRLHRAGQLPRPGGSSLEEERRESAVGSPSTRRGQWEDASRQGPGWTVRNLGDPRPWQMLSSPHTVVESAPRPGRPNRAAPVPDSGPLVCGSWPPCSEGGFPSSAQTDHLPLGPQAPASCPEGAGPGPGLQVREGETQGVILGALEARGTWGFSRPWAMLLVGPGRGWRGLLGK